MANFLALGAIPFALLFGAVPAYRLMNKDADVAVKDASCTPILTEGGYANYMQLKCDTTGGNHWTNDEDVLLSNSALGRTIPRFVCTVYYMRPAECVGAKE